jgi:hypothetical protein
MSVDQYMYHIWCLTFPYTSNIKKLFQPIGVVDGGYLLCQHESNIDIIFRGKVNDTLVFEYRSQPVTSDDVNIVTKQFPMMMFDLTGIKEVVRVNIH